MDIYKVVAERLDSGKYVVRPEGCLGTCGWHNGKPWDAWIGRARDAADAVSKARKTEYRGEDA